MAILEGMPLGLSAQGPVNELDDDRAFANSRGHPLDRAAPHVADGINARQARFKNRGLMGRGRPLVVECLALAGKIAPRLDEPLAIEDQRAIEPTGARSCA